MKTKNLAFKVTLASFLIILAAFTVVQGVNYVRDSILLETGSIVNFVTSFVAYIGTRVLPVLLLFACIIFLRAYSIQKTLRLLEIGENVPAEKIEKAKRGIKNFKNLILGLNLLGFTIGYVIDLIIMKQLGTALELNNLMQLFQNLASAAVYALAQNAVHNIVLSNPRSVLGIVSMEKGYKDASVRKRGLLATISIASYSMLFFYVSFTFALQHEEIYAETLEAGYKSNLSVSEITLMYQEATSQRLSERSARLQLEPEQIKFPLDYSTSSERFDAARNAFIILFFVMLSIAFGVQFASSSEIRNQLMRITTQMRAIHEGEGDLSQRIAITQYDEVGMLSDHINQFITKLSDLLKQVAGVSTQVEDSSVSMRESLEQASSAVDEMLASAEQVKKNTGRQQDLAGDAQESFTNLFESIGNITRNVESQATFIEETSSSIEEMAANIRSVSDAADQANAKTGGLEAVATESGKSVNDTIASIREIEAASKRVIQIIAMIQDMNEQTNLLAMNAAIEAAHAGQEGRGFAVVANEIKKLAEDGSDQAKQIVAYIDTMNERISNGVRLSDHASSSLTRISADTKDSAEIVGQISSAMKEQSSGAIQIVSAVESVVEATQVIRKEATDQDQFGKQLQELMEKLTAVSAEIDNAAGEQIAGDREVVKAVQSVYNDSEKNQQAIETLRTAISRFKLS